MVFESSNRLRLGYDSAIFYSCFGGVVFMKDQQKLNEMLEKAINKAERPMWKKNLEAVFLIALYFLGFPGLTIYLFWTGHWFFGLLMCFPTFLGIGIAVGGRKFTWWLLSKANFLKK